MNRPAKPCTPPHSRGPRPPRSRHTHALGSSLRLCLALAFLFHITPNTLATYTVALVSAGLPSRTVKPGDAFDLDFELSSDSVDRHDSSVLHLLFSSSGLILHGYSWANPYQTAGPDDTSVPTHATLPVPITATTASGTALPADTADLWFSNLTTSSFAFGVGRVLRLALSVPAQYTGPDLISIRLAEATLARGIRTLPTTTLPFILQIQPTHGVAKPALTFTPTNSNAIALSWDASLAGVYLESSDDPTSSTWTRITTPPTRDGDRNVLIPEPPPGTRQRFYRLRFP